MPIPQGGERRSPVHRQNTLPPPSPRRGEMGTAGAQESPSESGRLIGKLEGLRIADPHSTLSPRHKVIHDYDDSTFLHMLSCIDTCV